MYINEWDYLNKRRDELIKKYKMKFDNGYNPGSKAPIHKNVFKAWLNCEGRYFADAGVGLVTDKSYYDLYTKPIPIAERGHWEMYTPNIGSPPLLKLKEIPKMDLIKAIKARLK